MSPAGETDWAATLAQYIEALRAELPRFAVCFKDESPLQRLIGRLLRPFNGAYMTRYTTVMFGRVYFPNRDWYERVGPRHIYRTLRHEAIHLRDARRFPLLFQVSYLAALPAVFTMRAVWEWRAYRETVRVWFETDGDCPAEVLDSIEQAFVSSDYLFMFPFRRAIRRRLDALVAETRQQHAEAVSRAAET